MTSNRSTGAKKKPSTGSRSSRSAGPAPVLDDAARNDIYGIVLAFGAVALAIALLSDSTGAAGSAIASMLRNAFGMGAYLVPVILLLWGVTFFVHAFAISELRVGLGLGTMLLALIAMLSVGVTEAAQWESLVVQTHGGYLGGGVAWALRVLVGETIAYVLLAAVMLVGLVITGLSISGAVDAIRQKFAPEGEAEPQRPSRSRAQRTVPLEDMNDPTVPEIARSQPAARRRGKGAAADPEARKGTIPTPSTVAPRAMEGFELPPLDMLARTSEAGAAKHRATDKELKN
ncbi:MAG: DNA translocase FtsK 4TM domain-containing protein, partial [Coriobacteriia bacterium]